jgi:DNA-directed RNA polymerase beta' subunit
MRRITKRPRKKARKTRRRRNYRKMRGGEAKKVTVHVHDIIGGGVLFTIQFDYYPEYKVEDVYEKLTREIKTKFEDYHSSEVSGGAPQQNKSILSTVHENKDKILADIEIFANNPSIKAEGETNQLLDGSIVKYLGLYEKIPKSIKKDYDKPFGKLTIEEKTMNEIRKAYLNAIVKRVQSRNQPQQSSIQSQSVIHNLEFNVIPGNSFIDARQMNKGTLKIYNTPGAIKTDENRVIQDDLFTLSNFTTQLSKPGPIEMTVYVK